MFKLKTILKEDGFTDTENQILVQNKASGEKYRINIKSYDGDIHTILQKNDGGKLKKVKSAFKVTTPATKDLTPIDFIDDTGFNELLDSVKDSRPDLKKKIIAFDFKDWIRDYDSIAMAVVSVKKETEDKSTPLALKLLKKTQSVSISKYILLQSNVEFDQKQQKAGTQYQKFSNQINTYLRDKILFDKKKEAAVKSIIKFLDSYFVNENSVLQQDVSVYRGVQSNLLNYFTKHKKWVDAGFVSTSINPFISESFSSGENFKLGMRNPLLKFNLKKGFPCIMFPCQSLESCGATEIILPRGSQYVIRGMDEEANILTVDVEFKDARKR